MEDQSHQGSGRQEETGVGQNQHASLSSWKTDRKQTKNTYCIGSYISRLGGLKNMKKVYFWEYPQCLPY